MRGRNATTGNLNENVGNCEIASFERESGGEERTVDAVDEAELAVRFGALGRRVAAIVSELRATTSGVRVDLIRLSVSKQKRDAFSERSGNNCGRETHDLVGVVEDLVGERTLCREHGGREAAHEQAHAEDEGGGHLGDYERGGRGREGAVGGGGWEEEEKGGNVNQQGLCTWEVDLRKSLTSRGVHYLLHLRSCLKTSYAPSTAPVSLWTTSNALLVVHPAKSRGITAKTISADVIE